MTFTQGIILITCITNSLVAIGGVLVSLRNSRKLDIVHATTNGKMEQLIDVVKEASFAKGVKSEKDHPS
jgi:hypothetical protein